MEIFKPRMVLQIDHNGSISKLMTRKMLIINMFKMEKVRPTTFMKKIRICPRLIYRKMIEFKRQFNQLIDMLLISKICENCSYISIVNHVTG